MKHCTVFEVCAGILVCITPARIPVLTVQFSFHHSHDLLHTTVFATEQKCVYTNA